MAARDSDNIKRNVTPAQAVRVLSENGLHVSEKEAEKILDFLYFLGKLTVNQYIKDNSSSAGH
ncbi:hypothetical protein [Mucilaginibacter psychrotolerans]|uniref:DUF2624 family protein n=1 Tax=Mucilaginibacter psychrotolerans TaxID=1524096 RepID=A0A4Y8SC35_9SPHI|nr:hypothetical protein [Mucilaginibacter psychrotolerans]TFF36150.1 hypothetical protein E2R66_16530 [Mucilaginibacter psychrotolerans]